MYTQLCPEVAARSEWVTLGQDVGDALCVSKEQKQELVTVLWLLSVFLTSHTDRKSTRLNSSHIL